jgi:hypothetical protein
VALKLRAPIGLAKTPVFLYSVCSSAPDRKKVPRACARRRSS